MSIEVNGHYDGIFDFHCTKCHKLVKQIFRIRIGNIKRFLSTWLCLNCFNEIFYYCNKK